MDILNNLCDIPQYFFKKHDYVSVKCENFDKIAYEMIKNINEGINNEVLIIIIKDNNNLKQFFVNNNLKKLFILRYCILIIVITILDGNY